MTKRPEQPLTRQMGSDFPGSRFSAALLVRRLTVVLLLAGVLPGIRPELPSRHQAGQDGHQRCLHSDGGAVASASLELPPGCNSGKVLLPGLPGILAPHPRDTAAELQQTTLAVIDVSPSARWRAATTRVRGPPDLRVFLA